MSTDIRIQEYWCIVCCTDHPPQARCPGELAATGPEESGWKVSVETPKGIEGYGVLVAQAGRYWRARILTFPRILWTVPGGDGAVKFIGRTAQQAEQRAVAFIRAHCIHRGYLMRDELEPALVEIFRPVAHPGFPVAASGADYDQIQRSPRFMRNLPIRFGENRPTVIGTTGNLSAEGLSVVTDTPFDEGSLIGLMLEMEHCKVPLRGSVVWLRRIPIPGRPQGMGLELTGPPSIYVKYIQALE